MTILSPERQCCLPLSGSAVLRASSVSFYVRIFEHDFVTARILDAVNGKISRKDVRKKIWNGFLRHGFCKTCVPVFRHPCRNMLHIIPQNKNWAVFFTAWSLFCFLWNLLYSLHIKLYHLYIDIVISNSYNKGML